MEYPKRLPVMGKIAATGAPFEDLEGMFSGTQSSGFRQRFRKLICGFTTFFSDKTTKDSQQRLPLTGVPPKTFHC